MALVELPDFASFIRRDLDEYDGYTAQLMVTGAIDAVTEYCGWHIAPSKTETITVDGSGTTILAVPSLYVTDVTSVTELGHALPTSQIDWSTYGVIEKRSGALWTSRRRGVAVTIEHGFAAAPGWLVTMICAAAGRAFLGALGVVQEAAGGESATYHGTAGAVTLLPEEKVTLNRLRLPEAA